MSRTDVLRCQVINVGPRTYRVQGNAASTLPHHPDRGEHVTGARWQPDDEDEEVIVAAAREAEIDESLIQQEGSVYVARLSCDAEVYPFIIGREGRTRKQIEAETGAQVIIPRRTAAATTIPAGAGGAGGAGSGSSGGGGDIIIRGPTRAVVSSGYLRAQLAFHNAVSGRLLDYNFFISLPLASAAAVRQFEAFRRAVLSDPRVAPPGSGLEESIFMRPQHLHLTLLMLKLYSDQKRHEAQRLLARLQAPVATLLGAAPIKVHLQGLEYMNDDPGAMHVLYLRVQDMGPGNRLEALCDLVVEEFARAGLLLPKDERKVKLHATILNTRYRKRPQASWATGGSGRGGEGPAGAAGTGAGSTGRREERQPFDGRALLGEHGRLDLGIHTIQALHLSQRGAYGEDGYYRCARKLDLVNVNLAGGPGGTAAT
ncbi:hypothetical protein VaNZ11_002923 [Volvox africanus]|uniref:K Homology domain-containing protein n=1 Tax=Volvox africanus TaxID=51714 RepID=A0ABQ5RUW5_9CHLO|nr:hypothetical protein VaNZ11_002923 [Volvox africanus]